MRCTKIQSDEILNSQGVYSVGYDRMTTNFFSNRRADTHASFFLPYLRQGMSLLDCGCGPGTITVDLARIVSPAEVVAIDVEPSQIVLARTYATQQGRSNVRFEEANLYELPFADESFDAVFLHGVLEHLKTPVIALREVVRVLKQGGILGARHADFGGFILEPAPSVLSQFVSLFERLMIYNGADPKAGRHQLAWLRDCGFNRIEVSASYDCWTKTPEDRQNNAYFLANLVGQSEFTMQLLESGIVSRRTLTEMSECFIEWGKNPNAFAAEAWAEAVAWKK